MSETWKIATNAHIAFKPRCSTWQCKTDSCILLYKTPSCISVTKVQLSLNRCHIYWPVIHVPQRVPVSGTEIHVWWHQLSQIYIKSLCSIQFCRCSSCHVTRSNPEVVRSGDRRTLPPCEGRARDVYGVYNVQRLCTWKLFIVYIKWEGFNTIA